MSCRWAGGGADKVSLYIMFCGTVGALNVSCKQENMYLTDLGMDYILYIIYFILLCCS